MIFLVVLGGVRPSSEDHNMNWNVARRIFSIISHQIRPISLLDIARISGPISQLDIAPDEFLRRKFLLLTTQNLHPHPDASGPDREMDRATASARSL